MWAVYTSCALGKRIAFERGAQLSLTLQFETSGEITVSVMIHEP